ncbi:MAG: hypothetical protein HY721_32190, partial [Planctomycetes bacterium]|nr:hypothetical protein [Planctomycetota bacterium]
DGAGATRLRKLSPGTCVAIRGTSEIVGTRIADLSVLGGGVADRGIVCENLKDGEVERCAISGFRLHGIEGLGPATLNVMVRRTRITAPASALVEGCALSVRSGTSWRAEANYFNVGGTPESPRWGAIVDVRGHDGFFSQANVLDGAPTGIRSDGEITSVGDWWDVNASSGVWGYCYAHERNNRITIIGPRGPKKSKVDRSRFNARKWLTFVGGNRG